MQTRYLRRAFLLVLSLAITLFSSYAQAEAQKPTPEPRVAKAAFGSFKTATSGDPEPIGGYALGCMSGAKQLPSTGKNWQAMRLSRNRTWGHPQLVAFIQKLASDAHRLDGWPGLLVGDMAQPLGGPMLTGHASHQIGLDADIWLKPMPLRELTATEREEISADNMVDMEKLTVDPAVWSEAQVKLLQRAASYPEVARIFVHPAIKKALCETKGDRILLSRVRPWWGHNYHFHVRLHCPKGAAACEAQPATPTDDGCGAELDEWFKRMKAAPPPGPQKPKKPLLLSQMPQACQDLVKRAEQEAAPSRK